MVNGERRVVVLDALVLVYENRAILHGHRVVRFVARDAVVAVSVDDRVSKGEVVASGARHLHPVHVPLRNEKL